MRELPTAQAVIASLHADLKEAGKMLSAEREAREKAEAELETTREGATNGYQSAARFRGLLERAEKERDRLAKAIRCVIAGEDEKGFIGTCGNDCGGDDIKAYLAEILGE